MRRNNYGFHPALTGFTDLLQDNQLAVIQGVGYPDPNRSHFESMDIWHTCLRKTDPRPDGWLGRCLDQLQAANPLDVPAIHLGAEKQPFALASRQRRVPTVKSLEQFKLTVQQGETVESIRNSVAIDRANANPLLDFVQTSTETAIGVSQRFLKAAGHDTPQATYPETPLAIKLKTVAQLIDADLVPSSFIPSSALSIRQS